MAIAGVKRAIQLLVLFLSPLILNAYFSNHPSVNVPTSWQNFYNSDRGSWKFNDNTHVRPILALDLNGQPSFGFGFLRNGTTNAFYLVTLKIAMRPNSSFSDYGPPPVVLWSVNPNRPVEENATLELTVNGKLVLTDVDGTPVWSANTSGTFVTGMNLSLGGNLKLVNGSGSVVWQSYRFPTNTWLPEQRLRIGRNLHASVSMSNLSSGMFYLSITRGGINAYIKSVPPQLYKTLLRFHANNATPLRFGIGSLTLSSNYVTYNQIEKGDFQFMRMEPDGHLNVYQLIDGYKVTLYSDLLKDEHYGDCAYPTVCGNYGVCFEGQCSCAGGGSSIYFRQLNATAASFGCREVTPLSCPDAQLHTFLEVMNVTCFNFAPQLSNIDAESCRRECLKNCSCKAAMFRYQDNTSIGTCYLPSHIFSLMAIRKEVFNYNALAFIKVQRSTHKKSKSSLVSVLVPSILAPLLCFAFFISVCYRYVMQKGRKNIEGKQRENSGDESSIHLFNEMKKFSFEDLSNATQEFGVKLGGGGFGDVFEGMLGDGTRVAVKRLGSDVGQGRKEFLAEVKTIGSIHHFNLVRLVGYCAERSNRLLVYEFMCNGSLGKWIFNQDQEQTLNWETRKKIIHGIAEGLKYLHVHCNPNIIHFDIKPQNILLDEKFNVKISDFGLAKLISRDQSDVTTVAKGTPGYMAPEFIRGRNFSAKIDVYSFGILILEIIGGRKNRDSTQVDYLIDMVKVKAEEGQLSDLVDDRNEDMQCHKEEAVKLLRIGISCLQTDHHKRPSVSQVIHVLEGSMDVEPITDYSFLSMFPMDSPLEANRAVSAPLIASVLSGPR